MPIPECQAFLSFPILQASRQTILCKALVKSKLILTQLVGVREVGGLWESARVGGMYDGPTHSLTLLIGVTSVGDFYQHYTLLPRPEKSPKISGQLATTADNPTTRLRYHSVVIFLQEIHINISHTVSIILLPELTRLTANLE